MKNAFLTILFLNIFFVLKAQTTYYTVFQIGGNLWVANPGYKGAFNGYSAHFIFGKNFEDRAYLGLGLGNERFVGKYENKDAQAEFDKAFSYDQNTFPIFIDARLPLVDGRSFSKIGVLTNLGYAPKLSAQYDKGFLFKGGLFYLNETPGKMNWTVSAMYGYQQLTKNIFIKNFQHQQVNISVGLMIK